MPRSSSDSLTQFLRGVRRRAVWSSLLEKLAFGLLAGGGIAIAATALFWWRNRAAVDLGAILLGVSAIAGLAFGILLRPTRLQAAVQADGQLGLADLLSTAAGLEDVPASPDPWIQTVRAMADGVCRRQSASSVVFQRPGVRVWGAIALMWGLAFTLAIAAGSAAGSSQDAVAPAGGQPDGVAAVDRPLIAIASDSPLRSHAGAGPEEASSPAGQQNPDQIVPPPSNPNQQSPAGTPSGSQGVSAGDSARGGSGSGHSEPRPPQAPIPVDVASTTEKPAPASASLAGAEHAGGVGPSALATPSGMETGGAGRTSSGAANSAAVTPPWQSANWAQDVQAAHAELDGGRVPAAYRELVRKYFDGH